jgi:hypothetical protein
VRPGEIPVWEPGALVQIRKGVTGQGELGVVIGPGTILRCLGVLLREGVVDVHPTNLQKPDGRTRRRG